MNGDMEIDKQVKSGDTMSAPRYSLVVSTIGRQQTLGRLFDSLLAQTETRFEVILVDQSKGDELLAVVSEYQSRLTIRHVRSNQRGVSRGRNLGWSYARGEFLNFPDDDCWWPDDLLEQVDHRFTADQGLDALTTSAPNVARCDSSGGQVSRSNVLRRSVEFSLFLRRESVGDIRFSEDLGPGADTQWQADEGPDLMLRMIQRGARIEYFPELVIFHPNPHESTSATLFKRTTGYSLARGYFFKKHHYPLLQIFTGLSRTAAGVLVALVTGDLKRAWVRCLSISGVIRGYLTAGKPVDQLLQTPLSQWE